VAKRKAHVLHTTPLRLALQTYAFWGVVMLAVLNRLPFKLGPRGAGRRHGSGGSGGSSAQHQNMMFDDVAGVDEAKEELKEVVVSAEGGSVRCGYHAFC
jgi:ATP-dependent Zn protease